MVSLSNHDEVGASTRTRARSEWIVLLTLTALVVIAAAASLLWGAGPSAARTFLPALAKADSKIVGVIFWEIRVPRTALALMVGFTLGVTGAALQGFLRNPLAEPGLVGASSGAALGAVAVFYFSLFGSGVIALPFGGAIGALAALAILYGLSGSAPSVTTLILAGVAINAAAGALTSLLLNLAPNPFALYEVLFWLMGSVSDRGLEHVALAAPFMIIGLTAIFMAARGLDALTLGEDVAQSLGVHMKRLRLAVIGGTGLAVGAGVAVTGIIGFVGLIVPHLVRPFVGHVPSKTLLPSGLAGAAMLTLADLLVRLLPGQELKLGVVTALIGGPFFLMLILRRRSELT
ncbi:MAG: iron ABC transporter permease [Alphaproteobacteria bacterium]